MFNRNTRRQPDGEAVDRWKRGGVKKEREDPDTERRG